VPGTTSVLSGSLQAALLHSGHVNLMITMTDPRDR
jgi:hypothetical protein